MNNTRGQNEQDRKRERERERTNFDIRRCWKPAVTWKYETLQPKYILYFSFGSEYLREAQREEEDEQVRLDWKKLGELTVDLHHCTPGPTFLCVSVSALYVYTALSFSRICSCTSNDIRTSSKSAATAARSCGVR
jgi:hypothetical protein